MKTNDVLKLVAVLWLTLALVLLMGCVGFVLLSGGSLLLGIAVVLCMMFPLALFAEACKAIYDSIPSWQGND